MSSSSRSLLFPFIFKCGFLELNSSWTLYWTLLYFRFSWFGFLNQITILVTSYQIIGQTYPNPSSNSNRFRSFNFNDNFSFLTRDKFNSLFSNNCGGYQLMKIPNLTTRQSTNEIKVRLTLA